MSEVAGADGQQASPGALLRQAREAAGLHAETLAATLKVPVRKLEALEEDRYDLLPDAVFVRALASSVCRTLKIDPQPVLQRLPQTAQPRLVQDNEGINAPFRSPADGPKPGPLQQVSRPVVLIVAALLLAALAVIFLPVSHDDGPGPQAKNDPVMPPGTPAVISPPSESAPPPVTPAPLTPSTTLSQPPAAGASAPVAVAAAPAAPSPAAAPAPATAAPARPASAPAATATVAAAAPTPAASAAAPAASGPIRATGIVTFRTRGNSWVQVTDANGNAVLRKLMEAGETAGASGALPLSVTVGSVEQTEVLVRGKPFNLAPVSRDNVARFEVK